MRSLLLSLSLALTGQAFAEPLRLDDALARSREHQPLLQVAHAQVDVANARARQALSPWLPQVSAAIGYSRSLAKTSQSGSAALTNPSYDFFNSNVSAQQLLWDFGVVWNQWDAAKATAEAQAATARAAVVTSDLQVRTAFFAAAAQHDLVEVARATLANAEAHLAQVQAFVKVGTRPDIDLAQSRADRANARLQLVNATNAYTVAKARLNQAMGVEGPTSYDIVDDPLGPVDVEQQPVDEVMKLAEPARPELASFEAQLRAQRLTLAALRSSFWPTINATASANLQARTIDAFTPNATLGVNLSWQLYQGGQTTAQIAAAEATLAQLVAQRDLTHLQLRLDVEQALLDVGAAREGVEVSKEALDATREQQRLAEGRYNAGAGSMLEWADAQVRVAAAGAQYVQAQFTLATARARLLAAVGR